MRSPWLVVAPTWPCDTGLSGEVLACSLAPRSELGLMIEARVRDVAALTEMRFPFRRRSPPSTAKKMRGLVNVPLVFAGQFVRPDDLVVADNDGVVVVPRKVLDVLCASEARDQREVATRVRLQAGEPGLDSYGMREKLARHQPGSSRNRTGSRPRSSPPSPRAAATALSGARWASARTRLRTPSNATVRGR